MNELKYAKVIARLMIGLMKKDIVLPGLINTSYNQDFEGKESGDTIRITKKTTFVAKDFVDQIEIQSIKEGETSLTLNIHKDVSFALKSKERKLETPADRNAFATRFLEPAVQALTEAMEEEIVKSVYAVPNFIEGLATTPASLGDLSKITATLNKAGFPKKGRTLVVSSFDEAAMISNIPQLSDASKSGSLGLEGVTEANVGRIAGLDVYSSPFLNEAIEFGNKVEAMTVKTGFDLVAAEVATVPVEDGLVAGETLLEGDIIQFTNGARAAVAADITFTGTSDVISVLNLTNDVPATTEFQKVGKDGTLGSLGGQAKNFVFHRDAIAMATVPLDEAEAGEGVVETFYYDPATNLTIRVAKWYDGDTKTHKYSLDYLAGVKVVDLRKIYLVNGLQAAIA